MQVKWKAAYLFSLRIINSAVLFTKRKTNQTFGDDFSPEQTVAKGDQFWGTPYPT
jgi:hypothetical protein